MMNSRSSTVGPIKNKLITKGMVYSPYHGDTAFTVPMFAGFMKREVPVYSPDPGGDADFGDPETGDD